MKLRLAFVLLVALYVLLLQPFASYLKQRPVEVKLGYLPHPQLLKAASGEHATTVASLIVLRVLFYYGTIIQKFQENVIVPPEFLNMYKTLQGAVHIDPYNSDAHYFSQAAFTWELGRVNEVNHLLKQGMAARTWDPLLPFYLGFNSAYFLKDYPTAAQYMQRAAEISGNPLYTNLAARYFYESEQSALGSLFLETMIRGAKDKSVRKTYEMRRDALQAVQVIHKALEEYRLEYGDLPRNLSSLVEAGFLPNLPIDPYGGNFYLDNHGQVRSSSNLIAPDTNHESGDVR